MDGAKAMLSTLVAAKLAGRNVIIHAADNVVSTLWGCTITGVELQ